MHYQTFSLLVIYIEVVYIVKHGVWAVVGVLHVVLWSMKVSSYLLGAWWYVAEVVIGLNKCVNLTDTKSVMNFTGNNQGLRDLIHAALILLFIAGFYHYTNNWDPLFCLLIPRLMHLQNNNNDIKVDLMAAAESTTLLLMPLLYAGWMLLTSDLMLLKADRNRFW